MAALGAVPAMAQDESHVTVDSASGSLDLVVGYLPGEEGFSIGADRHLLLDGSIAVYDTVLTWPSGEFAGWQINRQFVLTSDFFASTGRLDGGDFAYEILDISPVSGPETIFAWGDVEGGLHNVARSDGATRSDRSFEIGFDGHPEFQQAFFRDPGLYDVTFQAWDQNGIYADSPTITVRYRSVPAPGSIGLLALGGTLLCRRRRRVSV